MKKISTMQVFRNEIFKEQKLTIGVDLGDRWSFYCVLDGSRENPSGTKSSDDTRSDEADVWKDTAKPLSPWRLEHIRSWVKAGC